MKKVTLYPQNVCSQAFDIELDDEGRILSFKATRGCSGNLQGIGRLVVGLKKEEVIERLEGIKCPGSRTRNTSCPDQLAQLLKTLD